MNFEKLTMLRALDGVEAHRNLSFTKMMERGVDASFFVLNKDYWNFVVEHKNKFGVYPDRSTFEKKFSVTGVQTPEPVEYYIDELCRAKRFKIMSTAMDAADKLFAVDNVDDGIKMIRAAFKDIDATFKSHDLSIKGTVQERVQNYENRMLNPGVDGIPSGISLLDEVTYGWHGGEFTVIMAILGSYKSWVLLFLALAAMQAGKKVMLATIEMGKLQLARRLDAILTSTSFEKLRSGYFENQQEFDDFKNRMQDIIKLSEDCIVIGGSSFGEMYLQSKIEEHNPDILLIDGLYLMQSDGRANKQKWEQLGDISNSIKNMSEIYDIPTIATTQMDIRKAEKKAGKEMVSWMNYSMGIAQAADNVISIGRVYDSVLEDFTNEVIVKTGKLREGKPAKFKMKVDLENMQLTPVLEVEDNRAETRSRSFVPDLMEGVDYNVGIEGAEPSDDEIPF